MKLFHRDHKWNFVDRNNVLLGYDSNSCCCEEFGWILTDSDVIVPSTRLSDIYAIDGSDYSGLSSAKLFPRYVFDPNYIKEIEVAESPQADPCDAGGYAIFRIIATDQTDSGFPVSAEWQAELFIVLYNMHNGWYSHNFTFQNGDPAYYGSI
jgi:hypothetical protein